MYAYKWSGLHVKIVWGGGGRRWRYEKWDEPKPKRGGQALFIKNVYLNSKGGWNYIKGAEIILRGHVPPPPPPPLPPKWRPSTCSTILLACTHTHTCTHTDKHTHTNSETRFVHVVLHIHYSTWPLWQTSLPQTQSFWFQAAIGNCFLSRTKKWRGVQHKCSTLIGIGRYWKLGRGHRK